MTSALTPSRLVAEAVVGVGVPITATSRSETGINAGRGPHHQRAPLATVSMRGTRGRDVDPRS
jgi:hypothetical protein